MKFLNYLNEWKVQIGYAGRDVSLSITPRIWLYLTDPPLGLIWSDVKGVVYHGTKRVGNLHNPGPTMTHKNLFAAAYDSLGLKGDMRDNIDDIVDGMMEKNVRGRIIGDTIFVYSGYDKRLLKKAVDAIYDCIPEED